MVGDYDCFLILHFEFHCQSVLKWELKAIIAGFLYKVMSKLLHFLYTRNKLDMLFPIS